MTKNEEKFLEFVCNFGHYESEVGLLFNLQAFLVEKLDTNPLIVFAKNKVYKKNTFHWRLSWSKEINNREGDYTTYKKIVENFIGKKDIVYKGNFFYIFFLGKHGAQEKYLVFSSQKSIDNNVMLHLSRFLKTSYRNILKFKVIGGLKDFVYHDDVTGLYNQRKLHKDLDEAIKNFQNYNVHFHVFFLDVDHFKNINDTYGHLTGTKLLLHIANLLKETLRESDLIYRYGGDEFVIIIPDITFETAMRIGRRILNTIKSCRFRAFNCKEGIIGPSISVGMAEFPLDAKTKDDILDIADRMMYQAKEGGRGQVCYARELFAK